MIRPFLRAGLGALALLSGALATPYTPKSDTAVLERLSLRPEGPERRALRLLRAQLSAHPTDTRLAAQVARAYLERAIRDQDPRDNGRAQAALAPWWTAPDALPSLLVLRATLKQRDHDFPAALRDLALAIKRDPTDPQAWLTRATVLAVTGDPAGAKRACLPLLGLTGELVALTCAASAAGLSGQAGRAHDLLGQALAHSRDPDVSTRAWATTVLAETAERAGRTGEADAAYQAALRLDPDDAYARTAYADFLLNAGRGADALALLRGHTVNDALLLRFALAQQATGDAGLAATHAELAQRFADQRARGLTVHRREQALFALKIEHDARAALPLAQANFAVQREPLDVELLLDAALQARQPAAARPALDFLRRTHLEGLRLHSLRQSLEGARP